MSLVFPYVDVGEGWLIFALPPAELGIHPAGPPYSNPGCDINPFMCDDIQTTSADLRAKGIVIIGEPREERWGITVMLQLPGGVDVKRGRASASAGNRALSRRA